MDWLAAHYAVGIRGKKWYYPLVMRGLQMAIVNAWRIYTIAVNPRMPLLAFTREIATGYMKKTFGAPTVLLRRRAGAERVAPAPMDSRYDGVNHFMKSRDKQRRCQGEGCTQKPLTCCKKCEVTLCKCCFGPYHAR